MKKFLLAMCASTPSVKGIYTALFILILSTCLSAQIEQKDNNIDVPFHKWEVAFDLKPLFRREEPFNLLVKRYTSPTKAWRFGMGLYASRSPISKDYRDSYSVDTTMYFISRKISNQINTYLTVGRQFEKQKDKLSIYTSSEIAVVFDFIKDTKGGVGASYQDINVGLWPANRSYVDTIQNYKRLGLTLSQSLGFKYHVNKQISISMEANGSLSFNRIFDDLSSYRVLTLNRDTLVGSSPFASDDNRWLYYLKFNPIAHIYLSYHF